MPVFQAPKICPVMFCLLFKDRHVQCSVVIFFFLLTLLVVSVFTTHPDFLDRKQRAVDNDVSRDKQIHAAHTQFQSFATPHSTTW